LQSIIDELFRNIGTPDCSLHVHDKRHMQGRRTRNIELSVQRTRHGNRNGTVRCADFRSYISFDIAAPHSMNALEHRDIPLLIKGELRGGKRRALCSVLITIRPAHVYSIQDERRFIRFHFTTRTIPAL